MTHNLNLSLPVLTLSGDETMCFDELHKYFTMQLQGMLWSTIPGMVTHKFPNFLFLILKLQKKSERALMCCKDYMQVYARLVK